MGQAPPNVPSPPRASNAPMSAPRPGRAVRVRVPASSANLGPGFDSIGMALGVYDEYVAVVRTEPGLRIDIDGDPQGVPGDERHLVYATMRRAWSELGVPTPEGLTLHCANTIRQGRGMGSSAAAIVAGVAAAHGLAAAQWTAWENAPGAADTLVDLDLETVNDLAGRLEGHPDNASASVYGGATISWLDEPGPPGDERTVGRVHSEAIPLHPDIEPLVAVPQVQLPTATARAVLPAQVPHPEAALNSARAGLLVLALSAQPRLLLPATREWLHQEQRRSSLGGAMEVVDELRCAGHAAVISGAGPSVLVLTADGDDAAAQVAALLPEQWRLLRPGVPDQGVRVERVTLEGLHGESALPA